jgi:hypothetical protein
MEAGSVAADLAEGAWEAAGSGEAAMVAGSEAADSGAAAMAEGSEAAGWAEVGSGVAGSAAAGCKGCMHHSCCPNRRQG